MIDPWDDELDEVALSADELAIGAMLAGAAMLGVVALVALAAGAISAIRSIAR